MPFGYSFLAHYLSNGHGGYSRLLFYSPRHGNTSVTGTTKKKNMNSIFPNLTPKLKTQNFLKTKYSRLERRHQAFVFRNNANGLYIKRTVEGTNVVYDDVPLEQATGFKFISLKHVAAQIPQVDITVMMAYRDTKTRKICVK